ncbi:MAG: hypothetical protein U9P88_01275, partial [Patescibacteria group bacterium]|nr:hypothetical protein [Patescibacteria group bacterium]
MINQEIAKLFYEMEEYLNIKGGTPFKPRAYRKAANILNNSKEDISNVYKKNGLKGLQEISGIGKSIAKKIEEYLKKGKIKEHKTLQKETSIRQIVTHYFKTKGLNLKELKNNAKKKKIVYSRFTKPAQQLLELAGSTKKAKQAIDVVAKWAKSRNLDYAIETVFKKWLELDRLKPKKIVKKPYYQNIPMIWSETKKKWFVVNENGEWLEFAGKKSDIKWKI